MAQNDKIMGWNTNWNANGNMLLLVALIAGISFFCILHLILLHILLLLLLLHLLCLLHGGPLFLHDLLGLLVL